MEPKRAGIIEGIITAAVVLGLLWLASEWIIHCPACWN